MAKADIPVYHCTQVVILPVIPSHMNCVINGENSLPVSLVIGALKDGSHDHVGSDGPVGIAHIANRTNVGLCILAEVHTDVTGRNIGAVDRVCVIIGGEVDIGSVISERSAGDGGRSSEAIE